MKPGAPPDVNTTREQERGGRQAGRQADGQTKKGREEEKWRGRESARAREKRKSARADARKRERACARARARE